MPQGTGVSVGIGLSKALVWQAPVAFDYFPQKSQNPARELERFEAARQKILHRTDVLRQKTARRFGSEEAVIFDAYRMMLEDEDGLLAPLRRRMAEDGATAEHAVKTECEALGKQFLALEDDYLRQRMDDVFSLRDQLIRELVGSTSFDFSHLDHPTVIVAATLSPADLAALDLSRLEGIVCETSGYASHTAIIARTIGVPAVLGVQDILGQLRTGDLVALDGESGEVWIDPDKSVICMLHKRSEALGARRAEMQHYRGRSTMSTDGRRVELSANIGSLEEVEAALAADAESLGLFRTELLHLNRASLPTEEEQFEAYRTLFQLLGGKAATVRTLDGAGHHQNLLPDHLLRRGVQGNPALGLRGIRMSLGRPSLFRTQLRALLRASAYGSLKVLFPMISTLDELDEALYALEQVKEELRREKQPFDEKVPVGVDIEVPSSALLSECIAEKVDFLSIGINDLIQFTLAVDYNNPDMGYIYNLYHPAVLRLVRWAVDAAHNHGIPCFISGEAPGYEKVLPLLLGIGVDGFTVSPHLLLRSRQILNNCSYAECRDLAGEVLQMHSTAAVMKRLGGSRLPGGRG